MLTCAYWKEVEEKEAKIIKSMESPSCEERLKGSESFSLKERRLKDDLAAFYVVLYGCRRLSKRKGV